MIISNHGCPSDSQTAETGRVAHARGCCLTGECLADHAYSGKKRIRSRVAQPSHAGELYCGRSVASSTTVWERNRLCVLSPIDLEARRDPRWLGKCQLTSEHDEVVDSVSVVAVAVLEAILAT